MPNYAGAKLPQVSDLVAVIKKAKADKYAVDDALEAEIVKIIDKSDHVVENHAKIKVWGDLSSGAMKNLWFQDKGDYVILKITEQFESSHLQIAGVLGNTAGNFEIYVNNELKTTQDLYSKHEGITNPLIDLGECEPKNNAFEIKFVYQGHHPKARPVKGMSALGLDYFIITNDFLKR
jgi:hypothetical protein